MGGDGEQRLGIFPDAVQVEVLQVLAGDDDRRVLLAHTLHEIADVLHGSQVGQKQVELIQAGRRIAHGQQLIAHKGEHVEQQGIL